MHLNNTDKLGPIKRGYDYSALSKESVTMESEFIALPAIIIDVTLEQPTYTAKTS